MVDTATAEGRAFRRGSLGLRARVTVAFGFGALALSAVLSILAYGLVRNYLLDQREDGAMSQTFLNAKLVRDTLRSPDVEGSGGLTSIETPNRGGAVLRHGDRWSQNSILVGRDALPASLRDIVLEGVPARMRFNLTGEPFLAVGVPIPEVGADYFEVFSLRDVDRTLEILGYSLFGAAILTTLAGAAIGSWAAARVVRPLATVSDAAVAIAGGRLDTRLVAADDPDLAPFAESFNQMVDALHRRIERDARFASDVSHELRSPLTTLSTSLDVILARRNSLPARARAALDLLAAEVQRFQRMVEDLLEISRSDAGALELNLEEVDPAVLVHHAVDSTGQVVPIDVDPGLDGTFIRADKRRLVRVIGNLIENAAAYGGGATGVVIEKVAGGVRISVEDQGPGVPVGERDQVFERFFRGSASGRRGTGVGSGLGLALVADHVALHGGKVWVEDGPGGKGARFVVELPEAA